MPGDFSCLLHIGPKHYPGMILRQGEEDIPDTQGLADPNHGKGHTGAVKFGACDEGEEGLDVGPILEVGTAEAVLYDIGDLHQLTAGDTPLSRVEGQVDGTSDLGGEMGIEDSDDRQVGHGKVPATHICSGHDELRLHGCAAGRPFRDAAQRRQPPLRAGSWRSRQDTLGRRLLQRLPLVDVCELRVRLAQPLPRRRRPLEYRNAGHAEPEGYVVAAAVARREKQL
ncbi:hypothetical protein P7K49_000409 [Saguinus oedipus]|uniref:Uncharacterized protein n=1 Tax=Saguinus oedipus TaxID=9490 RepID=A0ABQ9WBK5_SAGOE|nr:hypothetical protein P7K49_000409 [Saguinus oedipus]